MLDWQILEEGAAWPPPSSISPIPPSGPRRWWRRWRWRVLAGLTAILLPALVLGYAEIRRARQEMMRVENEVRTAAAAAAWLDQHNARAVRSAATTAAPGLPQAVGGEVRNIEVRGEYAMAELWTYASDQPWLHAPYRQTRFYRETPRGWLLTQPPDLFWQPLATLQTGRFTFIYGPRDAGAVRKAATQVETLDAALRREVGLPPTDEMLTVEIITNTLLTFDPVELIGASDGAALYAPSPSLLQLPAAISEGDALFQLVAGLLVAHDLDEALAESRQACQWRSLARGVRLWLLWEHSDLPSQARYQVEKLLEFRWPQGSLPFLTWVAPDHSACSPNPRVRELADSYTRAGIAPALVAYAVSAFGRNRLPALIKGMKHYDTWESLIPAVYGVSAAEFVTGWQEALVKDKRE